MALENLTVVDLGDIGRDVVASLAPKAFQEERDLRFENKHRALTLGNREAIAEIYRNLIDNALKHSGDNGPIEVVAGPGAQISVRDYGRGIEKQDREKLLEQFWRKNKQTNDGAGLGLGVVERLVLSLQGQIEVNNAPGGGAIFIVHFKEIEEENLNQLQGRTESVSL